MSAVDLTYGEETPVRVLVVDDHPAFRKALSSALNLVADIEVAGEAGGGVAACTEAEELDPDIIIMDLSMPDLSGIDAMKRIHERRPDLPVVILTAHADEGAGEHQQADDGTEDRREPAEHVTGVLDGDRKSTRLNSSHIL